MTRIAALLILAAALRVPSAAAQATPPPIQGVTGTIATEGSRDGVKKAAGAAARGVKKVLPGGGTADAKDPFEIFIEGSHVVVDEGTTSSEATVVDVNRKRQQLTVRFADKKTATLRALDRSGATADTGTYVRVSLADQAGEKIVYDFTRVP
jgi:hypothetical protein